MKAVRMWEDYRTFWIDLLPWQNWWPSHTEIPIWNRKKWCKKWWRKFCKKSAKNGRGNGQFELPAKNVWMLNIILVLVGPQLLSNHSSLSRRKWQAWHICTNHSEHEWFDNTTFQTWNKGQFYYGCLVWLNLLSFVALCVLWISYTHSYRWSR